ncbi:MAG: PQQ-dependent sugar dehydrogenase, partial [Planctomycetota bacterium]|nr:PQQ-dependent sugar dehydrogenase [Planctomycetota bacterium]
MKRIAAIVCVLTGAAFADDSPQSRDSRLRISLFAEHPEIVTPTGIDVDRRGRVWAIESNTHFPPAGYKGHASDRILVMTPGKPGERATEIVAFADGLTHAMSIAVRTANTVKQAPNSDQVFVATRRDIFLYRDTNGDDRHDSRERIIQLDTPGNYPHNGIAGFAFDALDWMYFGLGENLGADYKLIGSDGTVLGGGGEGGNLYRCRMDGSQLTRWATGFWNPHASCVDAFGRLFTVDNDADSRPPCRLLHIVRGGDYGYRFRNGRKGLHPFTAWDGEVPGTLPMVSGTGEAPSGIVAYESDGFPEDYQGTLLVGSWGDHRIDQYKLQANGASFRSRPRAIIQGGEDFRPVGLAVGPDGDVYCTDWVKKDYKVHGHGRVWRISSVTKPVREVARPTTNTAKKNIKRAAVALTSRQLPVRRDAARELASSDAGREFLQFVLQQEQFTARQRIEALCALARV